MQWIEAWPTVLDDHGEADVVGLVRGTRLQVVLMTVLVVGHPALVAAERRGPRCPGSCGGTREAALRTGVASLLWIMPTERGTGSSMSVKAPFKRRTNLRNQVRQPEKCAYHMSMTSSWTSPPVGSKPADTALNSMVSANRSEYCESELVASVAAFAACTNKQDQHLPKS